ncbi:hypothetical protein RYX41_13425 [Lactiplantibacillus plantarum]|nr:hypothetical protein [Lactiplantibacillus plantarum]
MLKRNLLRGLALVSLAGVLAGCGASQSTSKATSSSTSAKSTKTQTKRQRLISALPKGVKSTDSDLVVVNKWHKRAEMTFNKSSVDGIEVRSSIVKPLEAFLAGAKSRLSSNNRVWVSFSCLSKRGLGSVDSNL